MKNSRHQTAAPPELIACHDCGASVSFSAAACPTCGSREPGGPYIQSRQERRLHRGEQRNDETLVRATLLCCFVGVAYGSVMIGWWGAVGYGVLGAVIGVPAGFIISASRHLFD